MEPPVGVVERERNFRRVHRFSTRRAGKDYVRHLLSAQRLDFLLAQNPFNRVNYVRFPGTVRTNDDSNAVRKFEPRLIGETFESG